MAKLPASVLVQDDENLRKMGMSDAALEAINKVRGDVGMRQSGSFGAALGEKAPVSTEAPPAASTEFDPPLSPINAIERQPSPASAAPGTEMIDYGGASPAQPQAQAQAPELPELKQVQSGAGTFANLRRKSAAAQRKHADDLGDIRKKEVAAYKSEKDAIKAKGELTREVADQQYKLSIEQEGRQKEQIKAREDAEKIRQDAVNSRINELDTLNDDIRSAKIDPSGWFKDEEGNTDYGRTVGAALAVAFGAIGSAISGQGGNPALDIINRSIDRDISAQKANIANQRSSAAAMQSQLNQLIKKHGSERAAEEEMRIAGLALFKTRLENAAASTKSEEARLSAQQTIAEIDRQMADSGRVIAKEAAANADRFISQQGQLRMQQTQADAVASGANVKAYSAMAEAALAGPQGAVDPENPFEYMGVEGRPPTKEAMKQVPKLMAATFDMRQQLGELIDLAGPSLSWSEKGAIIGTKLGFLNATLKSEAFLQLGVLQEADLALLNSITGDPRSLMSEKTKSQLNEIMRRVNATTSNKLRSLNMKERGQTDRSEFFKPDEN